MPRLLRCTEPLPTPASLQRSRPPRLQPPQLGCISRQGKNKPRSSSLSSWALREASPAKGKRRGRSERSPSDRPQPSPPAGASGQRSCWANRQCGWEVKRREKAEKGSVQSDRETLERRVLPPVVFRVRRAGGVPTWANPREPTVRSERLKCSGFSADCLQPRVVFCSYRAEPLQEEQRPPGGVGRGEEAGSGEPRLLSAGLQVLSRRFLGLEVGVGGGSGSHPSSPRRRLRVRPLPSRAPSPAPQPPHEGVRAGSGGQPRALDARRERRRRRRRRCCLRRRGAGLGTVGAEHPARPALRRSLRLCLPAAVAAAPVSRAAPELPEPLPLSLSPVGSAQDHPFLRRLLAQRLPAPAPAARSPALLPPLAALLLPLLSPVLHALSPQPLPGGGKAGGPARWAGRENGAAAFNLG